MRSSRRFLRALRSCKNAAFSSTGRSSKSSRSTPPRSSAVRSKADRSSSPSRLSSEELSKLPRSPKEPPALPYANENAAAAVIGTPGPCGTPPLWRPTTPPPLLLLFLLP